MIVIFCLLGGVITATIYSPFVFEARTYVTMMLAIVLLEEIGSDSMMII